VHGERVGGEERRTRRAAEVAEPARQDVRGGVAAIDSHTRQGLASHRFSDRSLPRRRHQGPMMNFTDKIRRWTLAIAVGAGFAIVA
jgi:hypothetical protein